jgi:hypothetical protein
MACTGVFIDRSRKVAQSRVAQIEANTPFTQLAMDESVPELRVVGCKRDLDLMKDVSGVPKELISSKSISLGKYVFLLNILFTPVKLTTSKNVPPTSSLSVGISALRKPHTWSFRPGR